jgi:hypothetical protein
LSQRFLLYVIDDGQWHNISEVAKALEWPEQEAADVARYLAKGRFINYDEETGKVKLEPWVKKYPRGEWTGPGNRSTGAVKVPPDGSITLQETQIQNDLDIEVEIYFLVEDDKLAEVLISKDKKAPL